MTVELALAIVVGASYCCYLVWKWQGAAIPPYQEPLEKSELEPTPLNPKAAWPFPSGDKP
jgi:hypothetical protein